MSKLVQFFTYAHLSENLQAASKPICEFAKNLPKQSTWAWGNMIDEVSLNTPDNIEKEEGLKKLNEAWNAPHKSEQQYRLLLEAKDCIVRAFVFK